MRRIIIAVALAASLTPMAAQAAVNRPAAVSYAAPANLSGGMRAGAPVGSQSKLFDNGLGDILLVGVAFGAGFLIREWTHHDHHRNSSTY